VLGGIAAGVFFYIRQKRQAGAASAAPAPADAQKENNIPVRELTEKENNPAPASTQPNTPEHRKHPSPPTLYVPGDDGSTLSGISKGSVTKVTKATVIHPDGSQSVTITEEELEIGDFKKLHSFAY